MNTVATTQPKQAAYLVTHEYFHIVQNHVANVNAPMWYLEGMAEWEAFRLVGAPIPTWLAILLTDERQGRSHPFSTLETSEQWWQINRGASPYFKATAAILYLERLAGADAPIDVLRGTGVDSASFELIFSSVSGMGVEEFENTLPQFLEELYLEQLATQTPLP